MEQKNIMPKKLKSETAVQFSIGKGFYDLQLLDKGHKEVMEVACPHFEYHLES